MNISVTEDINGQKYVRVEQEEPRQDHWHWILKDKTSAVCSCCHKYNLFYGDFCKWCGRKMVEPQESEE